jgi:hypothetical protein
MSAIPPWPAKPSLRDEQKRVALAQALGQEITVNDAKTSDTNPKYVASKWPEDTNPGLYICC